MRPAPSTPGTNCPYRAATTPARASRHTSTPSSPSCPAPTRARPTAPSWGGPARRGRRRAARLPRHPRGKRRRGRGGGAEVERHHALARTGDRTPDRSALLPHPVRAQRGRHRHRAAHGAVRPHPEPSGGMRRPAPNTPHTSEADGRIRVRSLPSTPPTRRRPAGRTGHGRAMTCRPRQQRHQRQRQRQQGAIGADTYGFQARRHQPVSPGQAGTLTPERRVIPGRGARVHFSSPAP